MPTKIHDRSFRTAIETLIPFNRFLGIKVMKLCEGQATLSLPFRKEFIGDPRRPALHGGVISTLMDMAGGAAVWTELDKTDRLATVDFLVDYLQPASPGALIAKAKVLRIGNRVAVAHITVTQKGNSNPVAEGRAVYNIVRKNSSSKA